MPGTVPLRVLVELRTPAGEAFAVSVSEHEFAAGAPAQATIKVYNRTFAVPFQVSASCPEGHIRTVSVPLTVHPVEQERIDRDELGRVTGASTYIVPQGYYGRGQ